MQLFYKINLRFTVLVAMVLTFSQGCSFHPVRTTVVTKNSLHKNSDIPKITQHYEPQSNKYVHAARKTNNYTNNQKLYRVKYHPSYSTNQPIMVEGWLSNGNKYPVILDTGASPPFFINDIHILENKLPIYPISTTSSSIGSGKCYLPELHISKITLINCPCFYREQHIELQLFGLPIAVDKAIIAGLPALKGFRYIAFDGLNKEVEFSTEKVFDNGNLNYWEQYPFVIDEDLSGNAFLFVKLSIAAMELELQLDTGSGKGLAISETIWQQISQRIEKIKLTKSFELYPYIGRLTCKKGIIPKLKVGTKIIKDAKVSVFPDDCPLLDRCNGLIGMQFFQDTIMVIDFERNLIWVNNSTYQQPS